MDIQVKGANSSTLTVSDNVFMVDFNEGLVHQALVCYMSNSRQGTKAQKNRSAVSGGGAKPWRQKGTGRARAGTIRSPLFRKGGVTFAATPKEYSVKINKKMYRKAIASILSELQRKDRLHVIDSLNMDKPSTKELQSNLKKLELENVLLVNDQFDRNLYLSARNLPRVAVCGVADVNPHALVGASHVIISAAALKSLEERLLA
jgi:large subunit ribosomal protein L4